MSNYQIIQITPKKLDEALNKMKEAGEVLINGDYVNFSIKGIEGAFVYDEKSLSVTIITIFATPVNTSKSEAEDIIKEFFN